MVTLTTLLAINMVANVRSLSLRNMLICWSDLLFDCSSWATSEGERLKKAISEPLAKPDINSKTTVNAIANITPTDGILKYTSDKESAKNEKSNVIRYV